MKNGSPIFKATVTVLAFALVGAASAAGWRNLQIDASSEAAFAESVAQFQDKLSPSRRQAFTLLLQDVWLEGTLKASAEQREYTAGDYLRELDGLTYDEVVKLADPTGKKASRYRAQYYNARAWGGAPGSVGASTSSTGSDYPRSCCGAHGEYRGGTDLVGPAPGNPLYPGN